MIITEIKPHNKKKSKIYIDGSFAFLLYKGEMRRYQIEEGKELSEEVYEELLQEVLLKRGKARAMHLLMSMERTEGQLRQKLLEGGYPPAVIEQVLDYVKGYRYVDDERYASDYVRTKGRSKSVRQMKADLLRKGVSQEVIRHTIENQEVDESVAIRRLIEKKNIDVEHATRDQMQKLYQSLARRGFSYDDIRRELTRYRDEAQ